MKHVIELFIADHCPSCPDALRRVREFAEHHSNVVVVERNVVDDGEVAGQYRLFATPAVVIDGQTVMYGVPTHAQLAARCGLVAASAQRVTQSESGLATQPKPGFTAAS